MILAKRKHTNFRQLSLLEFQSTKEYHMAALSIVTRMYLTKVVKDAINRGLDRSFSKAEFTLTVEDKAEIANHIMDEMGKDTEKLLEIVRQFFVKSED